MLRERVGTAQNRNDIPLTRSQDPDFQVRVSDERFDPEWDAFVAANAGGQYVQSSLWSQVKSMTGWQAVRFTVRQRGEIVAGAQLLLRPLPLVGALGYVPRGPILAVNDSALSELVLNTLVSCTRERRCQAVIVQPPLGGERLVTSLSNRHFRASARKVAPTYSLQLDLHSETDDLLAGMKRGTRYNIRLGARKGLRFRQGTEADLPAYYRMLMKTSERQGFEISSQSYYEAMWRIMEPLGNLALILIEYDDEIVSAQLAIPFGNTVINKMTAWSGLHGKLKPNEAVIWAAIQWAKENGYDYYDFGGMSAKVATAVLLGEPLTERMKSSVSSFKLGFGGDIVVFPQAYVRVNNPILRWGNDTLLAELENSAWVKKIMHRLRTQ